MYSERNEMIFSLNCLISGQTSDDIFNVPIGDFFLKENIKVKFTDMTVANLKQLLSRTDEGIGAKITNMNLWKVELKAYEADNLSAKDIESHERSEKMVTTSNLDEYFNNNEDKNPKKGYLHVFIVPTASGKRDLDDSDDRKIKRHRTFAPSNRVQDDINYFIQPKEAVERLGNFLRDGKFCLLCGHRQSGKTTTAYAIEEWLLTNCEKDVYAMNLNNGIVINDGPEKFWWSMCCQLESLDENRFSLDKRKESSLSTFVGFFSKPNHPNAKECILIVDEASYIGGNDGDKTIIQSFIGALRTLKDGRRNQFGLYSVLLVGTELIKEFLKNHQRAGSGSILSPFSSETCLTSTRFTRAEIQELLHQYSEGNRNLKLDENGISEEIYLLTHGHKGLVGSCCSYIECKMMVGRCKLTRDDWNLESYNLINYIWNKATYESIIKALPNLSENQRNILGHVLLYRTHVGSENDPDVRFLLAEGMVIVEQNLTQEEVLLACAAPILRNILIYKISTPDISLSVRVPDSKTIDPKWLLERTNEKLTHPTHFHQEKYDNNDSGDPRLRLDILLKDGFPNPAYGYKLVVTATKKVFDDHVKRAKHYSKLHKCSSMYLVHLCNIENDKLSDYFGQECSDITPVHVIYDKNNGTAKLIYKNDSTDIFIKSFEWQVIWGINR
ncbi:P-loop containing nucleoside triphosphate hydrolase protein [Rhizophagus irregularis DAOM 181602=DAOM 197198]|nr:P-loop containing nucleoside triphosphate hydrolase protein [Rhizophagus irregularis DAOM 181602=DAOM 197198]